LEKGYNRLFWGVFIASFNIRLGIITILPPFLGWIVFFSGLTMLNEKVATYSFGRAQKFGIGIIIVTLITTITGGLGGVTVMNSSLLLLLPLIPLLLEIGLIYYVLEGSKEALENLGYGEVTVKLEKDKKTYLLFMGLSVLLMIFSMAFGILVASYVALALAIIARVYVLFVFSDLKKSWKDN